MRRLLPLALLVLALVFCASASATSIGYENIAPISPADRQPLGSPGTDAQHYPSTIDVSNVSGALSNVKVSLNGIASTFPGDLDLMLEAPNGRRVMLMSDAGGSDDVSGLNLTFRDDAAQTLPSSQLVSGDYRPTNLDGGDSDTFPAIAGGPAGSALSDLNGADVNGEWRLYVVDDASGDTSVMQNGWALQLTTTDGEIVSNSSQIIGVDQGAANPYPSAIDVSGLDRSLDAVTVTIRHAFFTNAGSVDLLLVAPDGRSTMLMSDAEEGSLITGDDIRFDDTSALTPPQGFGAVPVAKPVNYDPQDDPMPAPAPTGPYGSALSTFKGANPNGRWSLYLVDDTKDNALDSIAAGWSLNLSLGGPLPQSGSTPTPTPPPAPAPLPTPRTQLPTLSLSGLSVAPKAFKASHGANVLYRLSRGARVKFTIARKVGAHRFKKVRGTLSQTGIAGANKLRLKGKLAGRRLAAGSYRITATAIDSDGRPAASRSAAFRITR